MFKIFIVEDELTIRTELKTLLEKYGYECITTDDFTSVLSAIEAASPHLILLDINLPHFDGYHICREIRSHSQIPIIIVTSRNSDVDELMSMNLGADDFITKPYHTQILLARIAALLKEAIKQTMNLNWNTTALYCRYQTVPSQPMVKLQSLQK